MLKQFVLNSRFVLIGRFVDDRFVLNPETGRATGVYVFARGQGDSWTPLRFGVAFGRHGFQGRFVLHNRWLLGLFKPSDAAEQAARRFMLQGLHNGVEVWGCFMPQRQLGKALESAARQLFSSSLRLDRAAKGSWMKLEMAGWRADRQSAS